MATATSETTVKGGAWLVEDTDPATVMTPEKITDEHRMIGRTAAEFAMGGYGHVQYGNRRIG